LRTYVEAGRRRVFASVADWPGWCRAGKDVESALETLADYRDRYAPVAETAALKLPQRPTFDVTERLTGNATTDFGAPGAIADAERAPLTSKQAERLAALVQGAWTVLDDVVAAAPATLRKGPRGGGRDRDDIAQHVINAEVAYARKLGLRGLREPAYDDRAAVTALRRTIVEQLLARPDGAWPVRYAARRVAWHALDHAWEIEDKSTT
jgi:hypothetical protein